MCKHPITSVMDLCIKYDKRYPLHLLINDIAMSNLWEIGKDKTKEPLLIIYDELHIKSPMDYPDNYYCNTIKELLDIVICMKKNHKLYTDTF